MKTFNYLLPAFIDDDGLGDERFFSVFSISHPSSLSHSDGCRKLKFHIKIRNNLRTQSYNYCITILKNDYLTLRQYYNWHRK